VGGGDGRADPLLGQMGGRWALEIETLLGPVKFIEPLRECHLGPKKVVIDLQASKTLRAGRINYR
jgi:hypothetical protein